MKRLIKILALTLTVMLMFCACADEKVFTTGSADSGVSGAVNDVLDESSGTEEKTVESNAEHSKVRFTMENGGSFVIELYPEYAPETVENFIKLVSEGFYDGLTFHRVVDNFMAQGGDPEGTGTGGSDETIYGEFAANGFKHNKLSHTRGVVSMARSSDPDSASSQFFICYADATYLDDQYAAFGMVIEGMEVVDSFLDVERTYGSDGYVSRPVTPIVIEKAEVI